MMSQQYTYLGFSWFVWQLLVVDPHKRLRLKDALQHPWILDNTEAHSQYAQEPAPAGEQGADGEDVLQN
jgi:hypothetical protein